MKANSTTLHRVGLKMTLLGKFISSSVWVKVRHTVLKVVSIPWRVCGGHDMPGQGCAPGGVPCHPKSPPSYIGQTRKQPSKWRNNLSSHASHSWLLHACVYTTWMPWEMRLCAAPIGWRVAVGPLVPSRASLGIA